jgi:superfamily II DNA or RNA helicase
MEEWKRFELRGCEDYNQRYGEAILWKHVSTDQLLECGYWKPADIMGCRRQRLDGHKDFGLDALGMRKVDDAVVYDGIQMKCYKPKTTIPGAHMTGYSTAMLRMARKDSRNGGVLYIRKGCRIPREYRRRYDDPEDNMRVHAIPLSAEDEELHEEDAVPASPWDGELAFKPRPIQEEALTFLQTADKVLLSMACAVGKTFIAANHVSSNNFDRVIVAAPLIEQAAQLLQRFQKFLPDHADMAFWSGKELDPQKLSGLLECNNKCLISTTYDSSDVVFEAVLKHHRADLKTICIVDEAHNLGDPAQETRQGHKLAFEGPKEWHKLLMTATPPAVMRELVDDACDGFKEFQYGMRQAIQDGNCCDYTISMPWIIDNHVPVPIQLKDLTAVEDCYDVIGRAMFCAQSMLHDGARHCIVYCRGKKECRAFNVAFHQVCELHLGVRSWCETITDDVPSKKRQEYMAEFQQDFPEDAKWGLKVLTSVRILDEGVDLKKCDSIFMADVSSTVKETTWIRAVQRMFRAGRKDPMNPTKVARMYMWTHGCDDASLGQLLWTLRTSDPDVFSKVRYEHLDFDRARGDAEVREMKTIALDEWKQRWTMTAIGPQELVDWKVLVLCQHFATKAPLRSEEGDYTIVLPDGGGERVLTDCKIGIFLMSILAKWGKLTQARKEHLLEGCTWMRERVDALEADRPTVDDKIQVLCKYFAEEAPHRKEEGNYTIVLPDGEAERVLSECKIGKFLNSILAKWETQSEDRKNELLKGCTWMRERVDALEAARSAKEGVYQPTVDDKIQVLCKYFTTEPPAQKEVGTFTIVLPDGGGERVLSKCKIGIFLNHVLTTWGAQSDKLTQARKEALLASCAWMRERVDAREALRAAKEGVYQPTVDDKIQVLCKYFATEAPVQKEVGTFTIVLPNGGGERVLSKCKIGKFLDPILSSWGTQSEDRRKVLLEGCTWMRERIDTFEARRAAKEGVYQATVDDKIQVLCQHFTEKAPAWNELGNYTIVLPDGGVERVLSKCKIGQFLNSILATWGTHPEVRKNALLKGCSWMQERVEAREARRAAMEGVYQPTMDDKIQVLCQHFPTEAPAPSEKGTFAIVLPDGGGERRLTDCKIGEFMKNILANWGTQSEVRKNALLAGCAWMRERVNAREARRAAMES